MWPPHLTPLANHFPFRTGPCVALFPAYPIEAYLVRPNSIPQICQEKNLIGITGTDCLEEAGTVTVSRFTILGPPDYQPLTPKIYVGLPAAFQNINSVTDLANTTGITSYPNIAAGYFQNLGIPVGLKYFPGSIEVIPNLYDAAFIVDIWSSGRTAAANGIKFLTAVKDPVELSWVSGPSPTAQDRNRIADLEELIYRFTSK